MNTNRGAEMSDVVIVALISFAGTVIGAFAGSKLSNYRIEQLEKKVEKHNNLIERMYKVEGQIVELQHDVKELKAGA